MLKLQGMAFSADPCHVYDNLSIRSSACNMMFSCPHACSFIYPRPTISPPLLLDTTPFTRPTNCQSSDLEREISELHSQATIKRNKKRIVFFILLIRKAPRIVTFLPTRRQAHVRAPPVGES